MRKKKVLYFSVWKILKISKKKIDIKYDLMTNSADGAQSYKYVVRNVAQQFGKVATMMPKPISMDAGSGMHTNVSLWKKDVNTFYDKDEEKMII